VQVTCPACRGRKLMDYYADTGPPVVLDGAGAITETVEVLRDQTCRTCKGEGRIAATWQIAVMQDGERIGTVPPSFDPGKIESLNALYQPRFGDFRREGDVWIADTMLGPSDLDAVPGFVWERQK
jgi:hypothetical protein